MRSHQQKFLADVEAIAKEAGMELVVNYDYGNTGNFTITFEDSYEPVVQVKFAFNTSGAESHGSFEGLNNPERVERMMNTDWGKTAAKQAPDVTWTSGWYLEPQEYPTLLKAIRTECARALNARRAAEIESFTK